MTSPQTRSAPPENWPEQFLTQLGTGTTVEEAATTAGITRAAAYLRRKNNIQFREAWIAAVASAQHGANWREVFLAALTEGKTIVEACANAQVSHRTAYQLRHRDPQFAAAWDKLRPPTERRRSRQLVASKRPSATIEPTVTQPS